MGSKLDQTHAALSRISSALLEGKQDKRLDKLKAKQAKLAQKRAEKEKAKEDGGRKKRKQARTQDEVQGGAPPRPKRDQGTPFRAEGPAGRGGRDFDKPFRPTPSEQPTVAQTTAPLAAPSQPSVGTPPAAPSPKSPEPSKPTIEKPKLTKAPSGRLTVELPFATKAPVAEKPTVLTEPSGKPTDRGSFWDRVKAKVTGARAAAGVPEPKPADQPKSLAGRAIGLLGRIKKRIIGSAIEPAVSQTMRILGEERSSTTFKRCSPGAMVSTPYLRHTLPLNTFVNPDDENPTFPIRPNCRPSLVALGRAMQPDMANSNEGTVNQVLKRVNQMGGTRGKARVKLWGTGVGGKRMETYRGRPGEAERTDTLAKKLGISKKKASKLHGISTGQPDMVKHTPPYSPVGGSKGPAGNREVPRAANAHAKTDEKMSKGKKRRRASSRAVTIARGKAAADRL